MSSRTDKKSNQTYTLEYNISPMPKTKLAELIDKALKSGLTFRKIRSRSGNQITLGSLNTWHKGDKNPNMTTASILALAKGMGESPTTVFEAVIGRESKTALSDSTRQWLEDFDRLAPKDRNELKPTMEMLRAEIQRRLDRDA